jgi:hypothetical protein
MQEAARPVCPQSFPVSRKQAWIIDYLEDPKVDADAIRTYCEAANFKVQEYICAENTEPQVWDDFTGTHNFGFLIESERIYV